MKKIFVSLLTLLFCFTYSHSQSKQTYTVDSTTYIYGEYYKTTGKPKVQRSAKARQEFLKSKGYDKTPDGYHVDHIIPLSQGGLDAPSNMQLMPMVEHKQKTSKERKNIANKTIYIGSRGGQYYINSKGNKVYISKNK